MISAGNRPTDGDEDPGSRSCRSLVTRKTGLTSLATGLLLASLWSGCSQPSFPVPFEATRAGSFMAEMREKHGGMDQWGRFVGVTFSYRAQFRDKTELFDAIGFRFDDFEHVWIRRARETETLLVELDKRPDLRGRPVTGVVRAAAAASAHITGAQHSETFEGSIKREVTSDPELDFALRAIHFLFEPSLTTSRGRWRYRSLMTSWSEEAGERIEIEPWPPYLLDGFYLLERDPQSGLLSRILYRGTHAAVRDRTQMVSFRDYAGVQGITIAHRRVHRRPLRAGDPRVLAHNPFVPAPRIPEEVFLTEELGRITFLTAAEADAILPLPVEATHEEKENQASCVAGASSP